MVTRLSGSLWLETGLREKSVFDVEASSDDEGDKERLETDLATLFSRWESLVERYSEKKLTYGKDKLVALSGLASMFAMKTGDQYFAELWRKNLIHELTWETRASSQACRPVSTTSEFRAPTWSLASIDGEVKYLPCEPDSWTLSTQITTVEVVLADENHPTGPIQSAKLHVLGPIKKGKWVSAYPFGYYGMQLVCPGHPDDRDKLMRLYPVTDSDALEENIYCLQLGCQSRGDSQRVFGLVLVPEGMNSGAYKRIGIFQTPGSHQGESVLADEDWSAFTTGWSKQEMLIL